MAASTLGHPALPVELWLAVAEHVTDFADLAVLARTSSPLHRAIVPVLYARAFSSLRSKRALFWGVLNGYPRTVEAALDAGIDANLTWHSLRRAKDLKSLFFTSEGVELKHFLDVVDRRGVAQPGEPEWHWPALHLAAMKGNTDIVELLLNRNAKMTTGSLGLCACELRPRTVGERPKPSSEELPALWTPYHIAVCAGHIPVADLLVSRGATHAMEAYQQSIDWAPMNLSALHIASMSGHEDMLNWLLSKGNNPGGVESLDRFGQTPLVYAYLYQNWSCFDSLLQSGANKNRVISVSLSEDRDEWMHETMLYDAISSFRFSDALYLVVEIGVNLAKPTDSRTNLPLLHLLCKKPWDAKLVNNASKDLQEELVLKGQKLLEELLKQGMDPNESCLGYTALGYAAGAANIAAVECLLRAGAYANGSPDDMFSPLAKACQNQWRRPMFETVSLLIKSGASVNRVGNGALAPTWALSGLWSNSEEKTKILELLLENGASPARGTSSGQRSFTTPLEELLKSGDMEGFEQLLSRCKPEQIGDDDIVGFWETMSINGNADQYRRVLNLDTNGSIVRRVPMALNTLLYLKPPPADLVLRLLAKGADPNTTFGMSNLVIALMNEADTSDITSALLLHGANPNTKWDSDTPLTHLLRNCHQPLEAQMKHLQYLLDAGVSIYERLKRTPTIGVLSSDATATHLGLAIQNMNKNAELVEFMLERQPIRDQPPYVRPYEYIYHAFGIGNIRALNAIIRTCDNAKALIREKAHELIHNLLDSLLVSQFYVKDMMTTLDCLELLFEECELDLSTSPPETSKDVRTAKEKILGAMEPYASSTKTNGMVLCFRARIQFSEEDTRPKFLKPEVSLGDNDSTSLVSLGSSFQMK